MSVSMKDLGMLFGQGVMPSTLGKAIGLTPEESGMATTGALALGGGAMMGAPPAGGANVGGAGISSAAPQIGAYPGITAGVPAASSSSLANMLKIASFAAANPASPATFGGGLSGGQIQSSKQNNMPV